MREWVDKKRNQWSEGHTHRVLTSLEKDIFPSLGRKPINEITPPVLLMALRKIESRGALEVAQRVMQRCGCVFTYGIAQEYVNEIQLLIYQGINYTKTK